MHELVWSRRVAVRSGKLSGATVPFDHLRPAARRQRRTGCRSETARSVQLLPVRFVFRSTEIFQRICRRIIVTKGQCAILFNFMLKLLLKFSVNFLLNFLLFLLFSVADDIIRQHKMACLRVTALLAFRDRLWVGTSAGVILTLPLPKLTLTSTKLTVNPPTVTGLSTD